MDADAPTALFTALNAAALVLSLAAIAGSAVTWSFSRAGKVRAFENRVYSQLTNANARIENMESAITAHKLEITGLTDEMCLSAEKAGKERRRTAAENRRADMRVEEVGQNGPELVGLSRADQIRAVQKSMTGA